MKKFNLASLPLAIAGVLSNKSTFDSLNTVPKEEGLLLKKDRDSIEWPKPIFEIK